MAKLPKPPQPEPPRIWMLDALAPVFRRNVEAILAEVEREKVFESLRTEARQAWLYGFGKTWDDGRGNVTNARTALGGWHIYGLSVDIVEDDASPWVAPQSFWQSIGLAAERHGCKWGGRWKRVDLPHVQHGGCPKSPTPEDAKLFLANGPEAVWVKYGAI